MVEDKKVEIHWNRKKKFEALCRFYKLNVASLASAL